MKKTLRKLTLARETLRSLDNLVLDQAVGGAKTTACQTQTAGQCDYTFSCPENCPSAATYC